MKITKLDRMLLSGCFQKIGEEIREGIREPLPPCQTVEEFEKWRISMVDRLMAEPYNEEESFGDGFNI